jgi:Zn-dependent peptidase ImmA (M78 family)
MLNQKKFADELHVTLVSVSRWETGQVEPSPANVLAFSALLGYPPAFFEGTDVDEPSSQTTSFRSQTKMSAAVRDAALAAGAIGFTIADWVDEKFELPSHALPDLHLFEPEMAARGLREEWGLGEVPVSNMIRLLESKGVRVFSLAENTVEVNAYSLWRGGKSYVFLNTFKTPECSRFDAAHELGHLVLHQDGKVTGREAEDQANQFASAFLMPAADVLACLPRVTHLGQLIEAKSRWRVSLVALLYRVHKLGIISDWKYRDYCIQVGRNGYRTNEPKGIERETSLVWKMVLNNLWQEKITQKEIAADLCLPESEITGLLFGITRQNETPKGQLSLEIFG